MRLSIQFFILAVLLSGCLSHQDLRFNHNLSYAAYQPRPSLTGKVFEYRPAPLKAQIQHVKSEGGYSRYALRLPSSGDNGQTGNLLTAEYHRSNLPGARPVVVILPIWGTFTYPPDKLTKSIKKFQQGAVHVIRIDGQGFLFDWPSLAAAETEQDFNQLISEQLDRVITMVVDIRRLIDWIEQQPEIDDTNIALTGFSISAVVGALALANEPRIKTGMMLMGAADPAQIFATCDGRPQRMREKVIQRFNWSVDDYYQAFSSRFAVMDPANYAGRYRPENILIVEAGNDRCMTEETRNKYWQAMGKPRKIILDYGHKTAFLAMSPLGLNVFNYKLNQFLASQFRLNG